MTVCLGSGKRGGYAPPGSAKFKGRVGHVSQGSRGAAAVEFALVLPLLLLVIGGITDFGRAFYTEVLITNAAREGARAAMFASTSNQAAISARSMQALGNPGGSNYVVSATALCSTASPVGATTTVNVKYQNFNWIVLGPMMHIFGGGPTTLTGSATVQCGG